MIITTLIRAQVELLDSALGAASGGEDERDAYVRFVAGVRAIASTAHALQANGFPPVPLAPAPNAAFVQPLPEDTLQRREWNLKFNPGAEVTKAAP